MTGRSPEAKICSPSGGHTVISPSPDGPSPHPGGEPTTPRLGRLPRSLPGPWGLDAHLLPHDVRGLHNALGQQPVAPRQNGRLLQGEAQGAPAVGWQGKGEGAGSR